VTNSILLDASALVGILHRNDQWHSEASRVFSTLKDSQILTCEPVITEAWFLLGGSEFARVALLGLVQDAVSISFSLTEEIREVQRLVARYRELPMSLADACLVRMSEIFDAAVFTFDSDFNIYRRNRNEKIPVIGLQN